jgi:hypothetical protein
MNLKEILEKVNYSAKGIGGVPNNAEVDYFGKRVLMKPWQFRRLAAGLGRNNAGSVDAIKQRLQAGEPMGQPFLNIDIPDGWENGDFSELAKVVGHEGRNRAYAVEELEGENAEMEVHLFFPGLRARHITPEMMVQLNTALMPEKGAGMKMKGPFFRPLE